MPLSAVSARSAPSLAVKVTTASPSRSKTTLSVGPTASATCFKSASVRPGARSPKYTRRSLAADAALPPAASAMAA